MSEIVVRLTREGDLPQVIMEIPDDDDPSGESGLLLVIGPADAERLGASLRSAAAHCAHIERQEHGE